MYVNTNIDKKEPEASDSFEKELRIILGKVYDNQFFLNEKDLKVLRYLSNKGDHNAPPIILIK